MTDEGSPPASAYTPAEAEREDRFFVRASNFAKIIFVFVVLGPPIGAMVLFGIVAIAAAFSGAAFGLPTSQQMSNLAWIIPATAAFSYVMGGISALLVGFTVAIGHMTIRSFGIIHVVGIGLAIGLAIQYGWISAGWFINAESRESASRMRMPNFDILAVLSGVITMACWLIVSRWLRKVE